MDKHIFSVSELTRDIRDLLEDGFPAIWVEGEISTLRIPQSGHMYFTLKDEKAQLKCVFFKRANANLDFRPEEGLSCIIFGRISVYEQGGQYQLYVERMEPKGKGALQLAFEQLKKKLEAEGLFDTGRKRPLPFLAQKIGIVTSATGAAIRDILHVINRRYANIHIIIRPCLVQGKTAGPDIAQGIEELNEYADVDVIIVTRGGGSLEDLWPFNEEVVARAVYNSKIPVISAVGHEIDYTICDFVADVRAATPSAAAELVVQEKAQLLSLVEMLCNRMQEAMSKRLQFAQMRLSRVSHSHALRKPEMIIEQYQQRLDNLDKALTIQLNHLVKSKESQMRNISSRLANLNPLAVLSRGYSITYLQGAKEALKDAGGVKKGDILKTKLHKGVIISQVEGCEA
ncbi:MAG: exodeoxyribonuclease VII large subunit [Candidatus Omnitrophica bacterium]|nr:exodeoxyribonuclease VII large subunit [Candidatus Omnitrophota bacterium]MBU4477853.1 exodeoxyribonuclease VII large subunit [Candidatus Omnitrophota bacterium]